MRWSFRRSVDTAAAGTAENAVRCGVTSSLLVIAMLLSGCMVGNAPGAGTTAAHWIDWGVFLPDDGQQSSDIRTVVHMAGSAPHYVLRFAGIDERTPIPELDLIIDRGATPILTLEPWRAGMGTDQPDYALARIASGAFDVQLDTWARNLANWGRPVILRFGHEMNGAHYPWSVELNGNSPADYVDAWNHVRERFTAGGATNVKFMWCPEAAPHAGTDDLASSFPGTDAVDLLGLDGYNWGDGDGRSWRSPEEIFGSALEQLRSLDAEHPIVIAETASVEGPESGTDKARWIRELFDYLSTQDRVSAVVWFQMTKERDWRFNSSAQSQQSFAEALASRTKP